MHIAAAVLVGDQVGDDGVHKALALMSAAHRHAAQRVAKAAAGGNDIHIVIIHAAGIVEVGVPADPLGLKQLVDLVVGVAVCGVNLGNPVFGHCLDPFLS